MITRRKTLALLGGGTVLAAAAGVTPALTRSTAPAIAPWSAAGGYRDPRLDALSYAILAPNPHNRQPWLVDVSTPDRVVLYVDPDRLLPHTDPFNRQITIGLGCFLEVMRLAALERGYEVSIDLFPQGTSDTALDRRPVAICEFTQTDGPPDPLFQQVPHRRSLKEPFDTARPVDPGHLAVVQQAARHYPVQGTLDPDRVQTLRDLSIAAFETEFATPHTYKESVDLFRIGAREVNANPDGIDLAGPLFEGLRMAGLFSRDKALDPNGFGFKSGLDMVRANVSTAMGHIWQVTPTNTRADQIRAGADWVRINLAATSVGLGFQPLSQALQEFPEMAPLYQLAHEMMAPDGGTVQMWARIGYGPQVPQSPRWPLEAKLIAT